MTAETDLLPLPSVLLNWPHPTNHAAIRDYARANLAHATAAKDAEIEALRAEVERLRRDRDDCLAAREHYASLYGEQHGRAERLAEALRLALALARDGAAEVNGATDYMPAGKAFDITKQRAVELFNRLAELEARAALEQENDDA